MTVRNGCGTQKYVIQTGTLNRQDFEFLQGMDNNIGGWYIIVW